MYGFSPEMEIEGVVDAELQQICVGKFDLQFRFSSGTLITVQNKARVYSAGLLCASWTEETGWDHADFQRLLNAKTIGYEVLDESLLRLEFKNNLSLEMTDDSDQFESLQIYPMGDVSRMIVI